MKIVLSLNEALGYIREHEALNHLEDAEIVIEGFEDVECAEKEEAPKRRKNTEVAIEDINTTEVDTEESIQEEEQLELPIEPEETPLVKQEPQEDTALDLSAPLFG